MNYRYILVLFLTVSVTVAGCTLVPEGSDAGSDYVLEPGEKPPQFVTHNFINLEHVKRISKFRGAHGHSYAYDDDETCRTMKHYLIFTNEQKSYDGTAVREETTYYAPVDGELGDIRYSRRNPDDALLHLMSREYPSVLFRFHHIDPVESLSEGDTVEAGDVIGHVALTDASGEIAVYQYWDNASQHISFFDIASDEVFQEYRDRGIESRDELILTEEQRDAEPLECEEGESDAFLGRKNVNESLGEFHDWVWKTQFVELDE